MRRFWDKVEITGLYSCWEWKASKDELGYGKFSFLGKNCYAHRISYKLVCGDISKGLELDHLCRNPGCVSPLHLELVTHRENVRRGNATKTHCSKGHRRTLENLIGYNCKLCALKYSREYRRRNKERDSKAHSTYQKEYRKRNKKRIGEVQREYYRRNKEKLDSNSREYYIKNKEKIKAYQRDYYYAKLQQNRVNQLVS